MDTPETAPVIKSIVVPLSADAAFTLFTTGMNTWWPLDSHSVFGETSQSCTFPDSAGEPILEHGPDGRDATWGTVVSTTPAAKLVFTWHPGRDAESAQTVTVTFSAESAGTRVILVHDGWERLGAAGPDTREGYDTGWDLVFTRKYGGAAGLS